MSSEAFVRGDWWAVIEANCLESHNPAGWLRYGAALLHTITAGPEQGKQQQAALAVEQAKREGASEEEVMAVQRDVVRRLVVGVCGLAVQPDVAISSAERG